MPNEEKMGLDVIGEVPVCADCGSERVVTDAWACWNREAGLWELEQHFDRAHCHRCEAETRLKWIRPKEPPNHAVRELNDAFRTELSGRGSVMITQGVSALGEAFIAKAVAAIQNFCEFNDENDPWGEHDFGAVEIDGQKVFWKIDPFDLDLKMHSPNPANPGVTHRVLTIMLAAEY